jgi:hypothetical protein
LGATGLIDSSDGDRIFTDSLCVLIAFELEFRKKEDFRFDEFASKTRWVGRQRFRNTCGAKNKSSDYHLHLRWRITPPHAVFLAIEFAQGYKPPDKDEGEPFAEDFLGWFKQFVSVKELAVDVYSNFDYPVDPNRKLRFPLPMRAPVGPEQVEVEIDGISFKLSPPIRGIEKVWVTQGPKEIKVHLHAKKTVEIDSLSPRKELLEISEVLESLFERREAEGQRR